MSDRFAVTIAEAHTWASPYHIKRGDTFWWQGSLWEADEHCELRRHEGLLYSTVKATVVGGATEDLSIPVDEPIAFLKD